MSSSALRRDYYSDLEQDYRMLISAGPFQLSPGDSVRLQLGLALGRARRANDNRGRGAAGLLMANGSTWIELG